MKNSGKLVCLVSALTLLLTASGIAQSAPNFSPVIFTGSSQDYGIALSGYNFGSNLCSGSGQDCAYFRIGDPTCNKSNPGGCEAGYLGDGYTVNFGSWSPNGIGISGYTVGQPCDAVELGIWNSTNQTDGTVWAGNIPGTNCGTPRIYSVVFSGKGANLHITINGTGFGKAPAGVPCSDCDTEYFRFGDYAYHSFSGACGVCFEAGNTTSGGSTSITMNYHSWSNTQIVLTGFAGTYGQGGMVVNHGDPVAIDVWSTNGSGLLATAWSGTLP